MIRGKNALLRSSGSTKNVLINTGERFQFAAPEETSALMAELAVWIQHWLGKSTEDKHKTLISFLTELHQRFIRIHPFDDGNGQK